MLARKLVSSANKAAERPSAQRSQAERGTRSYGSDGQLLSTGISSSNRGK